MARSTQAPSLRVVQNPKKPPQPVEVLADSILKLQRGMKQLLDGPLTEEALILLIKQSSGVSKENIKKVLQAVASLGDYVKKEVKP